MPFFRPFRLLAVTAFASLTLHVAPAEAAAKSHKKESASKSTASKNSGRHAAIVHSVKHASKKSYAKIAPKKSYVAKTPPKKIDIAKLEPAQSLYHSHEAEPVASRHLSFFGSLASNQHYDSRMIRAAEIASARAYAHSRGSCWHYVKDALLDAGVVDSRPKTAYAKEAAYELTNDYGFRKIPCSDPLKAPVGSVLVYGGGGAGHVELRTKTGFVSDFFTPNASHRQLIGVYVKP
jgi:hypothetical protein